MIRLGPAIALAPLILWPPTSRAQGNPWERHLQRQIEGASQRLSREGYARTHDAQVGVLNTEESELFAVTLPSGPAYTIVGVCDQDCTSLHLVVLNEAQNYELAAARRANEAPVVHVTPRATARYHVKVIMASCKMNPCWYGVAVYRRQPGVTTSPESSN
jgi:hypothetical protein